jgi:GR25 family glycosyltransferase involved in LPS biosynthesis
MSHIQAWKKFIKSKQEIGLIFEDDAIFVDNFKNKLDIAIKNTPKDFDILYLGCFGCENKINFFTLSSTGIINLNASKINKIIKIPDVAFAFHGYVLSRKGAKKLINYFDKNISYYIDYVIQYLVQSNQINAYSLNTRLVYQTSTDTTGSTSTDNNHPSILTNILSNYYVDTKVRASYVSNIKFIRVGDINLSLFSIMFLFLGIVLSATDINMYEIIGSYLILSGPDLYMNSHNKMIYVHFGLLIIPYLVIKYFNLWKIIEK